MQYLKEEVRNRIAKEALEEFEQKGYSGASIRSIAKKSHTSTGNIYKYFRSKEDLFDKLIGSVYERLAGYIAQFDRVKLDENAQAVFYKLVDEIMDIFNENRMQISILFNQSKGSKYEDCKSDFTDFATRIFTQSIEYQLSLKSRKLTSNFLIYIITNSLVESIAVIVREKKDGKKVKKMILTLIDIYYSDVIDKIETEQLQ